MLLLSAGRRESGIKAVSGVIKLVEEARTGLAVPAKQVAELEPVARNPDPDSVTSRLINNLNKPNDGLTRLRGDHRPLRDICRRVVRGGGTSGVAGRVGLHRRQEGCYAARQEHRAGVPEAGRRACGKPLRAALNPEAAMAGQTRRYDLILRGGRVIDPASGRNRKTSVRIAAA